MAADILIITKKGNKIKLKVKNYLKKGYVPDHKLVVNLKNYKDVALFLFDLKHIYNVPIDKAIKEYQSEKDNFWAF